MSATATMTKSSEEVLFEKVTYPSFFEKLASVGISPPNQEDANELVKLARVVGLAVGRSVDQILAKSDHQVSSSIKTASDAAMTIAGLTKSATPETSSTSFMTDASITAAAQAVMADNMKRAGLASMMASAPAAKTQEEEDEEAAAAAKK